MIPGSALALMRVAALAPVLSLTGPSDLAAQAPGAVYVRRDECIEAGRLTAQQCEFAYRNARAEFEQAAPRYGSRAACERSHKRCGAQIISAGGWESFGKGGASYVPRFIGVRVSGEGAARRALPVVEGTAKVAFAGRPVTELQDKVAGRRGIIGEASSVGRGAHGHAGRGSAPYVRRGDRDDTVRVPMEEKRIGSDVPPGLYVDPDGVEWYKPARRH
ncbi:DUF1190 domain-containing protein [Bosea sp. (in: a-proteobacteria)]|uniref:DUF1190 domain-containing protein n=1 Tax=Bosea sp. (in: a-proteobacteria) TaxID=1871050 RepID=UPI0026171A79|nr:DUF1190 domain-containing protein [Bosea sp. (in: a-proteobacteria)]MCO5092259.1 DUF1190 domain-containing protein [Bosea sp. (in: a-proteobacteria)]